MSRTGQRAKEDRGAVGGDGDRPDRGIDVVEERRSVVAADGDSADVADGTKNVGRSSGELNLPAVAQSAGDAKHAPAADRRAGSVHECTGEVNFAAIEEQNLSAVGVGGRTREPEPIAPRCARASGANWREQPGRESVHAFALHGAGAARADRLRRRDRGGRAGLR